MRFGVGVGVGSGRLVGMSVLGSRPPRKTATSARSNPVAATQVV
ncbi:hypothetical protein Q5530_12530 [Saccharothrix sp. BKS2]